MEVILDALLWRVACLEQCCSYVNEGSLFSVV
jgi:hypothetical protein